MKIKLSNVLFPYLVTLFPDLGPHTILPLDYHFSLTHPSCVVTNGLPSLFLKIGALSNETFD